MHLESARSCMPTSGRTFSVGETSAPMDPNIQDTLNTLIDKIEKMDQQLQEVRAG